MIAAIAVRFAVAHSGKEKGAIGSRYFLYRPRVEAYFGQILYQDWAAGMTLEARGHRIEPVALVEDNGVPALGCDDFIVVRTSLEEILSGSGFEPIFSGASHEVIVS
jgi:hypothetical protein